MNGCEHDWEYQDKYTKRSSDVRRHRCRKCGIWAWQTKPNRWDGFKPKPIRPYRGPVTEPLSSWLNSLYREQETWAERPPSPGNARIEETPMELAVYDPEYHDPGEL